MFADVCGSTALIRADLEEGQGVIKDVIDLMEKIVYDFGGRPTRNPLGDGILALFANEDHHAEDAACASLGIHAAIRADSSSPLVRIGLHSDDVIVEGAGNESDINHITSLASSLAARMEQEAESGKTYVTKETVRLTEGFIDTRPLGVKLIKGFDTPLEIFEVIGRTNLTRFQAYTLRGVSEFVGRQSALSEMERVLDEVRRGNSRALAVVGDAGVGKSRLCHEFLERMSLDRNTVLDASATAYGRVPYAVLSALIRSWLKFGPTDPPSTVASRLDEGITSFGLSSAHRSVLASILGLTADDATLAELDPAQFQYLAFDAVRAIIAGVAATGMLILRCEDLQWLDAASISFLDNLILRSPASNILILMTYRPVFDHKWPNLSHCSTLHLDALEDVDRASLITNLIGNSPTLEMLRHDLGEKTGGNPFFIEETVRSLIENSVLVGPEGSFALGVSDPNIDLAPSVINVIQDRLQRLSPPLKTLIETASLLGEEIVAADLQAALGVDEKAFRPMLEHMFRLRMFHPTLAGKLSPFRFYHSTIREVVLDHWLLKSAKRKLHGRIFHAVQSLYSDRLQEHTDRLAEHSYKAGLWEEASDYCKTACIRAASRSANQEAEQALNRGIAAVDHVLESRRGDPEWTRKGIDFRLMGLTVLLPLGKKKHIVSLLREAEILAEDDEVLLGKVNTQLSTSLWLSGNHSDALRTGKKALQLARKHDIAILEKSALNNIGSAYYAHGQFEDAIRQFEDLAVYFSGDRAFERFGWPIFPSVLARTFLGSAHTLIGNFREAERICKEGLKIANAMQHPYSQTLVLVEYGYCLYWLGRAEEAVDLLRQSMSLCEDFDVYTMHSVTAGRLATVLSEHGQVNDAVDVAEAATRNNTHRKAGQIGRHYLLQGLATAYLNSGRTDEALKEARFSENLSSKSKERACNATAHSILGDIRLASAIFDEAENEYRVGLSHAEACGMRPLIAQCHAGLGKALLAAAKTIESETHLRQAQQMFEALELRARSGDVKQALERI